MNIIDYGNITNSNHVSSIIQEKEESVLAFQFLLYKLYEITQIENNIKLDENENNDIDFIEIGTSDFDTIIQLVNNDNTKYKFNGYSIEPVKYYLSKLPIVDGIKKLNIGIVGNFNNTFYSNNSYLSLFYIPSDIIDKYSLPYWLKGCNSIGNYHNQHILMNLTNFVTVENIPILTIVNFLIKYNIRNIKILKVDAEGWDINILHELLNYLQFNYPCLNKLHNNYLYYPNIIIFETNKNIENYDTIQLLINKFINTNLYKLHQFGNDCILEKI